MCGTHYRVWWRANRTDVVPEHGTLNGYSNYACRCEPCKAASHAYMQKKRNNK